MDRPPDTRSLGPYRLLHEIGAGGMGVVYAAEDQRLGRRVALKLLRPDAADPLARSRLEREARLAASIAHPLVCQVFELGEWDGQPFIAMELVAGEPLAARLASGPLGVADALALAISIADGLAVLHQHGIIHRDLKPSNIFVTAAGVKILDFGVARPIAAGGTDSITDVTQPGTFVGTLSYAAPEQVTGAAVDARADLFALGVILFEMLAGRRPFAGTTVPALVHAIVHASPPVLTGSPAIAAVDRVIHRALAKTPDQRHATAEALRRDLQRIAPLAASDQVAHAQPILRLAVLPFRLLKPDASIDYLGLSMADALSSSLLGFESLVVRSSLSTARYARDVPDVAALATELAVDVVLTGSMLRQGSAVRVNAQLVSVPAGDVWWTQTWQVAPDAVLDLHDELARRVVASLPLSGRDQGQAPAIGAGNARAFDLYLRGMQLRMETSSWRQARAFFEDSLAADPTFAAAWAERGRLDRVLGKYDDPSHLAHAESALRQALALDADNGAAQCYYAQLEIDLGRMDAALARLFDRTRKGRAEPYVYAALVHACRYGGLLDASVAADAQARRLDPSVPTSILHTYYMQGEYERALAEAHRSSDPLEARVYGAMGRQADAVAAARREEARFASSRLIRGFSTGLGAAFEGRLEDARAALAPFDTFDFRDGEGLFYLAEVYAQIDDRARALALLERSIAAGFLCLPAFERSRYFTSLRREPEWPPLLGRVRSGHQALVTRFDSDARHLTGDPQSS